MHDVGRDASGDHEVESDRDYMDRLDTVVRIIGDKWTLLIIGPLLRGPRRFNSLLHVVGGMTPTTLTKRLQGLEAAGMVVPRRLSSTVDVVVYDLTAWGRQIGAAVNALERWAADVPPGVSTPPIRWRRTKPPG